MTSFQPAGRVGEGAELKCETRRVRVWLHRVGDTPRSYVDNRLRPPDASRSRPAPHIRTRHIRTRTARELQARAAPLLVLLLQPREQHGDRARGVLAQQLRDVGAERVRGLACSAGVCEPVPHARTYAARSRSSFSPPAPRSRTPRTRAQSPSGAARPASGGRGGTATRWTWTRSPAGQWRVEGEVSP